MPLDDQLFARAKSYDRHALEALLETVYPAVHRMAYGLAGREDVGRGIVAFVMGRALDQLPRWSNPDSAERWFYHHTVLTSRRAAKHRPDPQKDILVAQADGVDADYVAFVRALRTLPMQQREAVVLHYGEKLNSRFLGVAMDCSMAAADQHLKSAEQSLTPLAGERMPEMVGRLGRAYARQAPAEDFIRPSVRRFVTRSIWPRRIKRVAKALVWLAILAGIAYVLWTYRDQVPGWIERLEFLAPTTEPTTQPTIQP